MEKQISLADVIQQAQESERASQVRCVPGIVKAFHAGKAGVAATVDVQCAVNDVRFDPDTGARVSEAWAIVPSVAIAYPKFGGFIMQGPLNVGDKVVILAFDLDPSAHQASGAREDPVDVRRHGGNYFVALPCDITDASAPADGATAGQALVVGVDGGQAQIRITPSTIQLGATGNDALALAHKVDDNITQVEALASAIQTYAGAIQAIADPSNAATGALNAAINAFLASIQPTGSALIKAQ